MENSLYILTVFFISNLPKASHLYLKSYWKRGFSDSRGLGASTEHGSFLALVGVTVSTPVSREPDPRVWRGSIMALCLPN